ncbi:MAG: FecR domain-containing protein [Marinomonas sp.]
MREDLRETYLARVRRAMHGVRMKSEGGSAMLKRATIGLAATLVLTLASPLAAAPEGNLNYTMVRGDTLNQLAADYFADRSAVQEIMRLNGITDDRRIPVGANIKIPRRYLRFKPVDMRVRSASGPVFVQVKGKEVALRKGRQIVEGDVIRTGRNGFLSIAGYGNSRLSLPSNSRARFVDARRYLINGLVDIQVKVLEGRSNIKAPKLKAQERYRVGTPVAVTAVRGTEFRVGYSPDGDLGLTEVVEGDVLVGNGADAVGAPEGFGVSASSAGVNDVEELLPAPDLVAPTKLQMEESIVFAAKGLPGAVGYRTQISRDATFLDIVGEVTSQDGNAVFQSLEDGRYHVRVRGIAESGLEGKSEYAAFKRKRIGVSAEAKKSEFADAFKFAWQTAGNGASYTAFQLWEAGNRGSLLVDEIGLTQEDIFVSDLPNGTYRWRVGTFQVDEGETLKVWGPIEELKVAD